MTESSQPVEPEYGYGESYVQPVTVFLGNISCSLQLATESDNPRRAYADSAGRIPPDPRRWTPPRASMPGVKKLLVKIGINGLALYAATLIVGGVKLKVADGAPDATKEKVLTILLVAVIFA